MKRLLLIYNPVSGKGSFKNRIDYTIDALQKNDFLVTPYRLSANENVGELLEKLDISNFQGIIAAGGDGTLNAVVSGIIQKKIKIPLGIIPVGTSNDFANHLGIKRGLDKALDKIIAGETKYIDVGTINNKTFINVVSVGNLTSIAHKTNVVVKNNLGKLAYYINVLGQYPIFKPFKLTIEVDGTQHHEDALLFFVLNSPCAGGFKNLAPHAKVDDGKLDVLVIKNCNAFEKLSLFLKVIKGEHHSDDCALYFQADKLLVECEDVVETDMDGEKGPDFPLEISCETQLKIYC
ncbi:YegS/Rv2252/BmrU family lipid kinase [Alkalicella caledoniensis]|uniref:YegS/Rv2252/BmrU family lipid kinase n=1 Tax=Alkalicella caledoniensis TaxID=2731377 RepID=A0A7G9WAA6_ALKCA|nr:YegS/Rv2252/BmrU family lipid kinase [Alkalicella caledoniensis]QNO15618.1 YegS/Rv2252/BmrU family lipid kinase [Alkalicella caledoniensis]